MAETPPLSMIVADAIKDAQLRPRDYAAGALACRYAQLLDADPGPETLAVIGPKLLKTLESLGMTPAGRRVRGGAAGAAPVAAKLDEFTARRRAREHTS